MSELSEFRNEILSQIRNETVVGGSSYSEEFINYVSQLLINSEEINDDITFVHYEGFGSNNKKKIQISGYSYDDFENCLNLYIVTPEDTSNDLQTLTNDDIDRYFGRCESFISDAEFITKNAEESHPAYGLAYDIFHKDNKEREINKYRITIVTDKSITKNREKLQNKQTPDGLEIEFSIIDINRLFQMESSKTGKVELVIDLGHLTNGNGIPCMLANKTDDYLSYLCNMPGSILADLYNEYGARLLEGNVRSFLQQKNKVNKGIRNTILTEPHNFFVYNNGITATAENIKVEHTHNGDVITEITGLQIVNGGQTTASLASCKVNDKKYDAEKCIASISVPMKLTVVSFDKALELIPSISRYANSQNKVSEADLWSNHPFHIRMEDISRRLVTPPVNGINGSYWYYERARGQYKQSTYKKTESEKKKFEKLYPKKQLLTKTDFAKYMNIRDLHPEFASLGGEKSFFKIATKTAEAWTKNDKIFNDMFFKEIVAIALLYKEVDQIVKAQGREYKANIDAYTVSYFLFLIDSQLGGYHINYKEIWNKQGIRTEIHDELEKISDKVYEVLTSSDRSVENVTEWAKRDACWTKLKESNFVVSSMLKEVLLNEDEYVGETKGAKKEQRELSQNEALIEIFNFGLDSWGKVIDWNKETKELTYAEEQAISDFINSIKRGKNPDGKKCIQLLNILDKAKENGYLG